MNWTIGKRLAALVGLVFVGLTVLTAEQVLVGRGQLFEQREHELKQIVDAVIDVLAYQQAEVEAGRKTLDEAQTAARETVRHLRYSGSEYFWINDMHAGMLMHPIKPELEGKDLSGLKDVNGKALFSTFVEKVNESGGGIVDYYWPKPGSPDPVLKYSYVEGFAPWGWIIGTGVYVDDLDAMVWSSSLRAIFFASIVLLVCGLASLFIVRSITAPVRALVARMTALREGDTASTVPAVERRDELGEMAAAVESFRASAIEREHLETRQVEQRQNREQRQRNVEDLIGQFRDITASLIHEVEATNTDLNHTAHTLSSVAASSASRAGSAADASREASSNVQSVASAAEELSASIAEISRQVARTTEIVTGATAGAQRSNEKVSGLATAANKIGEVVSLIQAIAEQTNLLALNATIEAARAGEAGRGFSVVASEVKELANQTSKATEEIGAQVTAIQTSTADAVEAIAAIAATMGDVNAYTSAIAAAVEQQGAATGEISQNVQMAAHRTRTVVDDVVELSGSINETGDTAASVLAAASRVGDTSSRLKHEVDRFLKDVAAA
ncbi:MAG: methyl-accepting chemotaxis protein [Hyphomicrobiales bacterium]